MSPDAPPIDDAARSAAALNNLGVALQRAGRDMEARDAFERACALRPDHAKARYNLGTLLDRAGEPEAALDQYDEALRSAPHYLKVLLARAALLQGLGRHAEAEADGRLALTLAPDHTEALRRQADLLRAQAREAEAEALLSDWLTRAPGSNDARLALGNLYQERFRPQDALAQYDAILQREPEHAAARINRLSAATDLCDWRHFAADMASLRAHLAECVSTHQVPAVAPSHAVRLPFTALEQKRIADLHAAALLTRHAGLRARMAAAAPAPGVDGRMRIGYLSADFRDHALMHLMSGVFAHHDRTRFAIHAYSTGPDDGSATRRQFTESCEVFVDLRGQAADVAAQRIRHDGIDVLVDLTGLSRGGRPELCAQHPAPIVVNAVGFPGTMGSGLADVLLCDAVVCPSGAENDYGERLLRLPHCYLPTDREQPIAQAAPSREQEDLPDTGFVFCSFNHPDKLEPGVFDLWMRILHRTPGSVLWQFAHGRAAATVRANLRREASARGIDPQRVRFAGFRPKSLHLARLRHADLMLDTLACNAHTTAVDALWAGLPVLSCAGGTFAARVGASLLVAVGMPELVTDSPAAYEETAVSLARDPDRMGALRAKLERQRLRTALFDTPGYVRDLEAAFVAMATT
ncbi:MAG: O-linked N-acetylglucosamine transferase, SPINDLY family protein [Panacagrimonas sp.]